MEVLENRAGHNKPFRHFVERAELWVSPGDVCFSFVEWSHAWPCFSLLCLYCFQLSGFSFLLLSLLVFLVAFCGQEGWCSLQKRDKTRNGMVGCSIRGARKAKGGERPRETQMQRNYSGFVNPDSRLSTLLRVLSQLGAGRVWVHKNGCRSTEIFSSLLKTCN